MSAHVFDPEIAAEVGLNAAVIFQNIKFWIHRNAANDENCYEGQVWTHNSVSAYAKIFPYLTEKQIRTALAKLEEVGLLGTGNFNEKGYDRSKWYCLLRQEHLPVWANGNAREGEPIPDNKPDNKPDDKRAREELPLFPSIEQPESQADRSGSAKKKEDRFPEFWKVYPKKAGKPGALKSWSRAIKGGADPQEIIDGAARYAKSEAVERGFVKHPQGWLNDERWKDDAEPAVRPPSFYRPAPRWDEDRIER